MEPACLCCTDTSAVWGEELVTDFLVYSLLNLLHRNLLVKDKKKKKKDQFFYGSKIAFVKLLMSNVNATKLTR